LIQHKGSLSEAILWEFTVYNQVSSSLYLIIHMCVVPIRIVEYILSYNFAINLDYFLSLTPTSIFIIKVNFVLFIFLTVRAALPRYRYDQLMRLGWKVFLPLSLGFVVLTAGILLAFDGLPPLK
jgi:NADH:ubiquinone oxidoreductase subunit H